MAHRRPVASRGHRARRPRPVRRPCAHRARRRLTRPEMHRPGHRTGEVPVKTRWKRCQWARLCCTGRSRGTRGGRGMFGKLFGRDAERPMADPHALPVPRRPKNGVYALRALGDTRVLALVEAADAGDWEAVKEALAPFDLGRDHAVLGQLADLDGVQDWIGRAVRGGQGAPGDRPADIRGAPHQLGLGGPHLRARRGRHAGAVAGLPRAARDRRGTAARGRRAAAGLGHPVAPPPHLRPWHVPGPRCQRDPARRRPAPRPAGPGDPHRVGVPAAAPVERRARPGPGVRPRSLRRRARRAPPRLRDRHGAHRGVGGVRQP